MANTYKQLAKEINEYAGSSRGEEAKVKYELLKLEAERKRNNYLFFISISFFIIAITDLVLKILDHTK
tara:strand:+ start:616 stop:819 length:204 start_codon:yes stop_codon:yes gene_type:complete